MTIIGYCTPDNCAAELAACYKLW